MTNHLPDGSRCEVCGLVGPRSHMDWSSVSFDPKNEFHLRLVKNMPEPFKSLLRVGSKVGFWAHVNGNGCDAETILPAEIPPTSPSQAGGQGKSESCAASLSVL